MGSDKGRGNELPVHKVNISTFLMAKYEVTVKEYGQFIKATGYVPVGEHGDTCMTWDRKSADNSYGITGAKGTWENNFIAQSDFHPVLCINTVDIKAYINWLSSETGKKYRLPSESEWEYAARAGTSSKYFFGEAESDLCRYGNVFDQTGQKVFKQKFDLDGVYAQCDDKAEYTTVVGMYQPNAYGLYDTIGNVGEIVADCEHLTYKGAPTDGSAWTTECDPFGPSSKMQIHRGRAYGQWSEPSSLGSSSRGHIGLDLRSSLGEGFRLARDISDEEPINQSTSTITFAKALLNAQKAETLRRQSLAPFPDKPKGLTIQRNLENGEYSLFWRKDSNQKLTTYNVYKTETIGGRYNLIAQGLNQAFHEDKTQHNRKHHYVITAVIDGNESIYSAHVSTEDVIKSTNAVIEAEDFNHMEGLLVGNITAEEEVAVSLNLTGMGGINKGNWAEYLVNVQSNGFYTLNYSVASAEGSEGFELLFNDNVKGRFTIPNTSGWRKWQTASGKKFYLEAGQYKVRIKAIASGWKLNWFIFIMS